MGAAASVTGPNSQNIVEDAYREKLKSAFQEELTKLGVMKDSASTDFDLTTAIAGKEAIIRDAIAKVIEPISADNELSRVEKIRQRVSYTFVCAVDGSEASDTAFELTNSLLRRQDHLCMFHAFCEEKNSTLPANLKYETIRDKYDTALISKFPKDRYSFLWEDRGARTVKQVLMELSNMYRVCDNVSPDFMVLGYTGRKGITKTEGPTTCGSNSDFTMRHIHIPCIIAKYPVDSGPKTFVMSVNKSVLCRAGLDLLFGLVSPRDTLTIISVDDGVLDNFGMNTIDETKQYYEKMLVENASAASAFRVVQKDGTVGDTIIRTINEIGPDFCAIAPRAKEYSGSFTEQVILNVKANVILCKS